ncbi:MAG TPA: hypothetical protein PK825_04930 [Bacteroidales bacterium]|nr:hypothetical protein [Bacteroidales bacterium]
MKHTVTLLLTAFVMFSCSPKERTTPEIKIPTVTTGDITMITTTSAICSGNVTAHGGDSVTARGVCWGTSANPTVMDSKTTNGSGTGTFAGNLTGLTPNTTYYVRAYATNSVGTAYGEQRTFTTEQEKVVPSVSTGTMADITTTTATCSDNNVTADGGASVTERGVCWGTSANPTVMDSKTTNGSGTGTFAGNLTGLTPNTTYYVRAYATNSVGTAYGEEKSFKTLQEEAVTDLGDDFYLHSAGRVVATHYKNRNLSDLMGYIYSKFQDEIDFVFFVYEDNTDHIGGGYNAMMNDVQGLGEGLYGEGSIYNYNPGGEHISGVILFGGYQEFNPELMKHELCHRWANYIRSTYQLIANVEYEVFAHWGFSDVNGMLGGFDRTTVKTNIAGNSKWYCAPNINSSELWEPQGATMGIEDKTYAPLELYLMGLIPAEEVPDVTFYSGLSQISNPDYSLADGYFAAETAQTWSIQDFITRIGERVPAYPNTQREFRILTVILTKEPREIQSNEWTLVNEMLVKMSYEGADSDNASLNFWEATLGKATLKVDELDQILK